MTDRDLLNVPMGSNDADAATVGEYLTQLLLALWQYKEGFSGKRPFGNSGWDYDLYLALMKAGLVEGTLDEFGYIYDVDEQAADALIEKAIKSMVGERDA